MNIFLIGSKSCPSMVSFTFAANLLFALRMDNLILPQQLSTFPPFEIWSSIANSSAKSKEPSKKCAGLPGELKPLEQLSIIFSRKAGCDAS